MASAMDFTPVLNTDQLADMLQVERHSIQVMRDAGMPHLRDGPRIVRFNRDAVLAWVGEQRGEISQGKARLKIAK